MAPSNPTKNEPSNKEMVSISADQLREMQEAIAVLQKDRESADAKDDLIAQLVSKVEDLQSQVDPQPKKDIRVLPVYNDKPPAAGYKRVRIKSARGVPAAPKVRVVDDTIDKSLETYRCHGFLYPREVVDVPVKDYKDELKKMLDLDLIEETSAPATRPLFYANEALARLGDPYRDRTPEQVHADIERAVTAQKNEEQRRVERAKAEAK